MYEFHITVGHPRLARELNAEINSFAKGTPVLAIQNLDQEGSLIRTDWMTAEKASLKGGHLAALHFLSNSQTAKGWLTYTTNAPERMKIEAEYNDSISPDEYLYIETHFAVTSEEARRQGTGISRNLFTGELIATERCYDSLKFHEFAQEHSSFGRKVELCLYDSNVSMDSEAKWMRVPKNIGKMSARSSKIVSNEHVKIFDRGIRPPQGYKVYLND